MTQGLRLGARSGKVVIFSSSIAAREVESWSVDCVLARAMAGDADELELSTLVRRHQMTWKARPELAVVDGALAPVGFVVELTAVHNHPSHPPSPGCRECAPVIAALQRVCNAALPRGEHPSWYEVHVSHAFEMGSGRGEVPKLSATIEILHRGTVNRPIDECERACLGEIQARLARLGVRQGS